jgi:hypothetical protein
MAEDPSAKRVDRIIKKKVKVKAEVKGKTKAEVRGWRLEVRSYRL